MTRRARGTGAVLLAAACASLGACGEGGGGKEALPPALAAGDPARGRAAIARLGCGACHVVPGVPGAEGLVGPPLARVGARAYLAGVLPNNAENMIRWIRAPREVDPDTAMPDLGVGPDDARDIAVYLHGLR